MELLPLSFQFQVHKIDLPNLNFNYLETMAFSAPPSSRSCGGSVAVVVAAVLLVLISALSFR